MIREPFMALVSVVEPRSFAPGQPLITEGEPGRSSFVLVEGRVDVVRTMDGGEPPRTGPPPPNLAPLAG